MGDAQSVSNVTSPWASLPLFAGAHLQDPRLVIKTAAKAPPKECGNSRHFCKVSVVRYLENVIIQKCNTIKHFAYFSTCARITQKQFDTENVIAALEAQRNNVSMHDCR